MAGDNHEGIKCSQQLVVGPSATCKEGTDILSYLTTACFNLLHCLFVHIIFMD